MKHAYDKNNVYFTLFLNHLKYEEEAYAAFVEFNLKFQQVSGDVINAHYDFETKEMIGAKRKIKAAIDIEDIETLQECYFRYNFYTRALLDTKHYEHVLEKMNYWQKKYIENINKYGEFSEVNFIDKKLYVWG